MATTAGRVDVDIEFEKFKQKQEEIYTRFQSSQIPQLVPNRLVVEGASGYLIAWQYSIGRGLKIANFGQQIAKEFPFLAYPADFLHTTISDYKVVYGTAFDLADADDDVLYLLRRAVAKVHNQIRPPKINLSKWFFSKDTVIVAGYPDKYFIEAFLLIQASAKELGIELRSPWGGHITVGRFTGPVDDPEKINRLRVLLANAPCCFWEINPTSIIIGRFNIDSKHFIIKDFGRFHFYRV